MALNVLIYEPITSEYSYGKYDDFNVIIMKHYTVTLRQTLFLFK